jgi:hypothetical protein
MAILASPPDREASNFCLKHKATPLTSQNQQKGKKALPGMQFEGYL